MDNSVEKELIEKIRNNDPQAENKLINAYLPKVRMIVGQRIHNREDQPELVNDIFMGLLIKLREGAFDSEQGSTLSSYINGIVHNRISQYLKNYYIDNSRQEKINEHITEKFDDYNAYSENYEDSEETENKKELWRKLINQLKPKYKEILYLRFYENLTVKEIAKRKNMTPQKISDYIKYSKKLLFEESTKKKNNNFLQFFFQIFSVFSNI